MESTKNESVQTDTKHTPGPWEIVGPKRPDPRQIDDRLIFATVEGERLHIAEVYQYLNHNNREANGTAIANARLIAAAPEQQAKIDRLEAEKAELLEALKLAGIILQGEWFNLGDKIDRTRDTSKRNRLQEARDALNRIRVKVNTAIAKAERKQSP